MGENLQTLKRIVALLLSLADLAERASVRPWPVLCLVLCFLRPAEAIARRFVVGLSPPQLLPALSPDDAAAFAADARAGALRLAVAFRILAMVLDNLVATDPSVRGRSRRCATHDLLAATQDTVRLGPQGADTS